MPIFYASLISATSQPSVPQSSLLSHSRECHSFLFFVLALLNFQPRSAKMPPAFRWLHLNSRQREICLNVVFGSSAVFAYNGYRGYKPILADSDQMSEHWKGRSTVVSHNASLVDRTKRATETREGKLNKGTVEKVVSSPQSPPPQTKGHSVFDTEGDVADGDSLAWKDITDRVTSYCDSFVGLDLSGLQSRIIDSLLPSWVRMLPGWLDKLNNELSMAPWSLSWEIWEEAHDPEIHPEIIWDAQVRFGKDLCAQEKTFLSRRRLRTTKALSRYLDVPEKDVHPDDVPTIAMCASGGGLRALVAGNSSYLSSHEDGLFDCVTYTAGVSGSCWLQTLYYSSIGQQSHARIIDHLKQRLGVHIAYPPALLEMLSQAPTNKFLLSGYVEKLRGVPDADFGLVDVYGLALAARFMVPRNELNVSDWDLKISNQRFYTDDGQQPLPIYTAVRHEIPAPIGDLADIAKAARFNAKHYDWFQWFEWTPYEFFAEELEAGIPTWAVGRRWQAGQSQWRENGFALPELRVPLYMGIWGSAFCATLSHYYREIRPILTACGMGGLDTLLSGKDQDMVKVHPIDPAVIPNFALGLRDRLPPNCPEDVHQATHLQLMDAGMANNLPIYPLLRPGRDVDVIIAFDASSDVRGDNWIKVVDGYARQRGIKGWPMGAGWPPPANSDEKTIGQIDDAQNATLNTVADANGTKYLRQAEKDLSHCTVWVGSTEESQEYMDEPSPNRFDASDSDNAHVLSSDAGIALIYFPFIANDKVPDVDPLTAEFMSTWNFVYTPEEIDKVVALAKANFEEGKAQTRRTIRAVWEQKRQARLEREKEMHELAWSTRMKSGGAAMRRNGDAGHGDQFSGI